MPFSDTQDTHLLLTVGCESLKSIWLFCIIHPVYCVQVFHLLLPLTLGWMEEVPPRESHYDLRPE